MRTIPCQTPHLRSNVPKIREHYDRLAEKAQAPAFWQRHFRRQINAIIAYHVRPGQRVLEWGCGTSPVLEAVLPSRGLGLDLSAKAIEAMQARLEGGPGVTSDECRVTSDSNAECRMQNAELRGEDEQKVPGNDRRPPAPDGITYAVADLDETIIDEPCDAIVLNYVVGYLEDVQRCLENLQASAHARTRLYITAVNTVWRPFLRLGERIGLIQSQPESNWLSRADLINLMELAGWDVLEVRCEQLLPVNIPLLTPLCNRFLARLPLIGHLCLTLMVVARPRKAPVLDGDISCSVIVPARNESGNIRAALERIPVLGKKTEVIFVEGNSRDDTWEVIQREVAAYKGPYVVRAMKQPGEGKWDAVRTGFEAARGDILVIQDADLTAPPEDLPKFYEAVSSGTTEFANGSRLVYPMEKQAMRFLNLLGNKFFALALSYVLHQQVKDSLCGTKMLLRSDYERILPILAEFGDFDPFGDFNLLFGSARLGLKIKDVPVRYRDRTYGETNISRFTHGWILLMMTWFGLRKLRFHACPCPRR